MSYEDYQSRKNNIKKDWNELALKQFSGFDLHPYESYLVTPFAIIFITRPKLFIKTNKPNSSDILEELAYKNMALHPFLSRFIDNNVQNKKDLLTADLLSYSNNSTNSSEINNMNFIPIFTNKVRNFSVDPNNLATAEQGVTKHGFRHIFPTHNVGSISNGIISLELNEMKDLEISNMVGIWYNTIIGMVSGELRANPNMVRHNRIDYVSSLYYFKLDRDAKTIKYWAKYNGVFPIGNPSEAFGWQASNTNFVSMNVNLTYDSREELTLSVLDDFNNASIGTANMEFNSNVDLNTFTLDMFTQQNVLEKASELVNKVPLVYYVEDNNTNSEKTKKRFIIKLGTESVYKSASEELFDVVGHFGSRNKLYDQSQEE
jgi:hypothetical protein